MRWIVAMLLSAASALAEVVLDEDFSGPVAPLTGRKGWVGRNAFVQRDGNGVAALGKGADGFVKHPFPIPESPERIRFAARVRFSPLPGSAMCNHHRVGKEQPAWVALGFMDNSSPQAGLAASKLSVSVSSDGERMSIGLGRSVGAREPAFGVYQTAGDGCCELALEYDFARGMATAFLDGTPVLTHAVRLRSEDFSVAGFQLRRMQPLGSAESGGLDWMKIECTERKPEPLPKPELPFGSRINSETVRARKIEASIDGAKTPEETLAALREGWENPPATYRPHTRWWWPGNAVTKEGIDFQLLEMKDKGLGGVEIISFISVYTQGNIDFNSDEFVSMVKYAVDKARSLGMEVTPPLVPGWNHGHASVPEMDGAKAMIYYEADVEGGSLSLKLADMKPREGAHGWERNGNRRFDALIAIELGKEGTLDLTRRIDLTGKVSGGKGFERFTHSPDLMVTAELPAGRWRLMAFWTALTGQKNAAEDSFPRTHIVDHFQKGAVENYLKNSGARFAAALGGDYGQTVDSFFGDSFEVHSSFSFWSIGLYERFEKEVGYDLRPFLPMLVYDGAPETPYVRYDVGHFLHRIGMESMVHPLAAYAKSMGVQMRQQPHYRFACDIIAQSGVYQRPETENTKRSFDPMFWHKLTTSGAWLYPSEEKKWVSAEAFTFINDKYRTTMEEIKRGTDLFLRDGITQFYNHGYFYTPEKELAPSRDLLWMNRISHVNTWWPWYRGLADYQARAAFLSRQGRPECNVLVYAPYPTLWAERAEYPVLGVRDLPFGPLPKILVSNGYDFDCVNDDLLLNHARIENGELLINGFNYSVLILPRTIVLSPESLEVMKRFVESGGTVMALSKLPTISTGLIHHEANGRKLAQLRKELFNSGGGSKKVGEGQTLFFPEWDGLDYQTGWFPGSREWMSTPPLSPEHARFVRAIRKHLTPDFEISDAPQSNGLTFRHTRIGEIDCWFICNLQPNARKTDVTLNTKGKIPQVWDAMDGSFRTLEKFRFARDGRIVVHVDLLPWASQFVLLTSPGSVELPRLGKRESRAPEQLVEFSNPWNVSFQGLEDFRTNLVMNALTDWTKFQGLENVSGTATYVTEFQISNFKSQVFLDLGEVHEVASVRVNGQDAGKVWMQPYRLDISKQLKPGKNRVEITVANLLWNYAAGLKEPKPIPEALRPHYGTGWNRKYNGWSSLQEIKRQHGNDRVPSGLIGPVTLSIYDR